MRRLEIVQLVALGIAVLLPVLSGYRLKRGRMAALLVAVMTLQLTLEGYRWQLLPLEVATIAVAVADVLVEDRRVRGFARVRRGVTGSVLLAAVAALPLILPIPELPRPPGPFPVGTQTFLLVDEDRQERYGLVEEEGGEAAADSEGDDEERVTDPRRLMVQVWYPAEVAEGSEPEVWNPDLDVVAPALGERMGFPGFFLSHTQEVRSHAHPGADPLSGRLPVIVYSHGWTGFRSIALNQLESLASQGFLVVAADHTYGAIATRFPDGEVVAYDPLALPEEAEDGEAYREASELLVETFSEDIVSILDALAEGTSGPFGALASHADLDLVGVFGHSTGGGAAVRTCLLDDRCDAVAGLDAWVSPIPDHVIAEELAIPSLFVRSDEWRGTPNDRRLRGLSERSPAISYWIGIEGTHHTDLVMTPLFSPVADRLGLTGPIDPDVVVPLLEEYLHGFFDRHLLGVGGAVLEGETPPAVEREILR